MARRSDNLPTIHLLSVASSCKELLKSLRCRGATGLIRFVQEAVGDRFRVTGVKALIEASEDDRRGGRQDDTARAQDIQHTFADDRVVAAVALRGGAWLTRILDRIDFDALKRRRTQLALFGFSELTPLLNVAARYGKVRAYYDLCPGFLLPGMTHYARRHAARLSKRKNPSAASADAFAAAWARDRFRTEFTAFFKDVVSIITGSGSNRSLSGRLVRGKLPARTRATVVGGNLTTMIPLLASHYARALHPKGRWLAIEDIRETPDRVDRLLSCLSLSGRLKQYEGIFLGNFRDGLTDHTTAALACLDQHLRGASMPVVALKEFGHIWPMSPLPLCRPFELTVSGKPRTATTVQARIPWPEHRLV